MKSEAAGMTRTRVSVKKMILTAFFGALGYVLSTFVYFPAMAPFQHFVNVLAAVFVGPWYGFAAGLVTASLRVLSGRTLLALVGAVFGAFLSGFLYRRFQKLYWAVIGEVVGTGIISAVVACPVMNLVYGTDFTSPFYYIPFFIPASMVGSFLAVLALGSLRKMKLLDRLLSQINQ